MAAPTQQTGFSYAEVLLAALLLLMALGPALQSLQTGFAGAATHEELLVTSNRLTSRMEEMLAEPFGSLDQAALAAGDETTPSSYSDPAATPDRLLVYLSRYDADDADSDANPFTGTDEGLIWVRVAIEGTPLSLETLVAQ